MLWLFVLRSFLFRSVQFQKLFAIRNWAGPLTWQFEHVTLAIRSEVSTGKVKRTNPNILKGNDIKPLIIISSHDVHSNNHRIRSSTEMNVAFKLNINPRGHIGNSGLATGKIPGINKSFYLVCKNHGKTLACLLNPCSWETLHLGLKIPDKISGEKQPGSLSNCYIESDGKYRRKIRTRLNQPYHKSTRKKTDNKGSSPCGICSSCEPTGHTLLKLLTAKQATRKLCWIPVDVDWITQKQIIILVEGPYTAH